MFQPAGASAASKCASSTAAVDPGVVMLREQSARFSRREVQRENPAVLVVGGARNQKCLGARFIPNGRL